MQHEFSRQIFEKILKYINARKSSQWVQSCYTPTDGQTDMIYLIIAFRDFAKALKITEVGSYINFAENIL
jgi:hypothetical protein